MKKRLSTRVLSLLLVAALLMGMMPTVYAESSKSSVTVTQVDNSAVSVKPLQPSGEAGSTTADYADTDVVRVSIILEKESTIRAGFSTQGIGTNEAAVAYRQSLKKDQAAMVQKIEKTIGMQLDVVWNLTLIANLISANLPYGQIEAVRQIPGVKEVVLENEYMAEPVETADVQPNMATSGTQIGSGLMWDAGYTGAGTRIAVVDTGTDTNHQSLNAKAFEYALAQLAQEKGMSYEDYVASLDLLDAEEIAAVGDQLNMVDYLDVEAAYFNTKLPFGFNYQDADYDITHDNDEEGEHGSHVAGIATANSWLYNAATDTYGKAMDYCFMQGVAPEAQLLTMKVFGKAGAPTDADYFAAIEDAIILGADVVNLSLGSIAPGRGTHNVKMFQDIMDELQETDTVVAISAGNSGPWAEMAENNVNLGGMGYLYSTDVSQHTVGQPGSFTNSLAVASVENDGMIGFYIDVAGKMYVYNEDNRDGQFSNQLFVTIAGEHEYIFIDGVGKAEDWAAVADVLPGKIAFCSRGETNFSEKANLAVQAGAIAVFIYNNQNGVINLDLTEYQHTAPVAAVTKTQGEAIRDASTPVLDENGNVKYRTGKLTVSDSIGMGYFGSDYYTMSTFSSWGVPGSLELKPEITAPGGNIYSLNGLEPSGGGYEIMSGTSMASPQVAGMAALMAQYIQENGLAEKTGMSERHLIQSLLMSTAQPLLESEGVYYPVLQQGAGLANVYEAMSADTYITMAPGSSSGAEDGKIKVELFDDPDRTGSYSATFTVHNLENEDKVLNLNADFFTQGVLSDGEYTYMDYATAMLGMNVAWTVNGAKARSAEKSLMDFNGDGKVDTDDGQTLLDFATGIDTELFCREYADVDGDGDIDSHDAYVFLKELSTSVAALPAGGEVEITVSFSLTADARKALEEAFPNGTYIQGYLFAEVEGGASHSIPVLGFYGNWSDPSMFDLGMWPTFATGEDKRIPYIGRTRGNDFKVVYDWDPGYNYSFGGNPLIIDATYMPERNAMNSADTMDGVSFIAIRHAEQSRVTVTNETKGETVMEQLTGAVNMAYYYGALGWQNSGMFLQTHFDMKDASEGDRMSMSFTLVPEYYVDGDGNVDWDALGTGTTKSISWIIDNTAPVLSGVSIDVLNNTMTVTASDNQYIAAVGLYNKTGTRVLAQTGAKQDIEKGETAEYTFSLDKVNGKKFLLQVFDYAMNAATYMIEMQIGEKSDLPEMMAYDVQARYWCSFDKDFVYDYKVGVPKVADADHIFFAATIAEHYAFASTDKGDLFVMPEDDLTDTTFIVNMGQIMYDMAYSVADDEIYAVNDRNELFTINKLSGELTRIGEIGLNTNTLACDKEGNFFCNELGTGKVYSFTLETMGEPKLLMEDPFLTRKDPINGDHNGTEGNMGMEFNPNTGLLCWNSHLEVNWGSMITFAYYYEIDPKTGEFTRYADFWHEMGGLMIPDRTGAGGGWADPTNKVIGVKLNRDEVSVITNTSTKLTPNVMPWTAIDRTVTWSSADESIAIVDQKGVITGVSAGTTTIRATSNLDPSFYAECVVHVENLDVTLHGTTNDANGNSMFYSMDMSANEGWKAGASLPKTMTSASYSTALDAFYMMDNVTNEWKMHKIAADGTVLQSVENPMGVAMWDMVYNPYFSQVHGEERVSGVYYYYLLSPKNPMALNSVGFNLGDLASYLVGITSKGYEQQTDEEGNVYETEHLILLDNDGYVWDFWVYDVAGGGMNALYNITKSDLSLDFPGDGTMDNLYTSLTVGEDGNLYLSTYNGDDTNEIWHLSYDEVDHRYVAVKVGEMGSDVYPATIISVTNNGSAAANAAAPKPAYTMSAAEITDAELAAAASKASFSAEDEQELKLAVMSESQQISLELGKNGMESGKTYTYTAPADGRMEFKVSSVVNSADSTQYSWTNGTKLQIRINGKAMTTDTFKTNVTAGQVFTVEFVSIDGDSYTANMALAELEPAQSLVLGTNDNIRQDLEYVYIAEQDGTVYVSMVELLYNDKQCTESDLSGSVRFYVNGKTVYAFNHSVEVKAGDELLIQIDDYSWDGSGVPVATISLSYEGFYQHPVGSLNNPVALLYADCPTSTIEIAADGAAWYALEGDPGDWMTPANYPFEGKYLVVTGENAYVQIGSTRYDAENGAVKVLMGEDTLVQIGNAGSAPAVFAISVEIPEGHVDNPQILAEGDNVVTVPRNGTHYFAYTAESDGTVTVKVSGENWKYVFEHYNAEGSKVSGKEYRAQNGDADTQTLELLAGEKILVAVGTYKSYSQPGGEITVNFGFESAGGTTPEPDPQFALVLGKNTGLASGSTYTYTVPADGRLDVTVNAVYNSAGEKQYAWTNGMKLQILVGGKAMTDSSTKFNVAADQIVTVEILSVDGDTYTADVTLKEIAAAEPMTLGTNSIAQNLEYVYVAEQDGTIYVSVVEMLYNNEPVTASALGNSVLMTINGASVSAFEKSYEVKTGDEIAVVVKDYSWDGSGVVNTVIDLSYEGFYQHPVGSFNNPIELLYNDCPVSSVEIAAGSAAWYELESYYDESAWQNVYPFDGKYLVVTGENAYIDVEGTVYSAENGVAKVLMDDETMVQIGNAGSVPAVFTISVEIPEGHKENPQDLQEGDNKINLPRYTTHYYDFTAAEDGTVTVTVSGENWKYTFEHYDAEGNKLFGKDFYAQDGDPDTQVQALKAGEKIIVAIGTYKSYSQPGGEMTVSFHFELPACQHANTNTTVENEIPATCTEDGSYETVVTCADCGEELSRETTVVPATGHDYQDGTCANCGEADPNVPDNTVYVDVVQDVDVTNGVVTVTWDPAKLTLTDMDIHANYTSLVQGEGFVTFGYVSLFGIEAGESIATFVFEAVDPADALVTIEHKQINNEELNCEHQWSAWTENALAQMERWCDCCGAHQVNPFADVPTDSFYIDPVLWALDNGITTGTTVATFSPDAACVRGQAVTFLWRAAGCPEPTATVNPFVDVTEADFYYKAVLWAVENGITNGMDENHFGPMLECNRAQIVTFLHRAMGKPAAEGEHPFTDLEAGAFYEQAVIWAYANGIASGLTDTAFGPNANCNRAQIVTFLFRAYA